MLPNIQSDDSGTYTVTVTNTTTQCEFILSTVVDVTVIPNEPQIEVTNNTVCSGGQTTLSIPEYPGTEVHYQWFGPGGSPYPDGASLEISNFTNADEGFYQVIVNVDGCASTNSAPVFLALQTPLQAPSILGNNTVCPNNIIDLTTDFVADEYIWTGPNGFTSDQQNPAITISAAPQHEGDYSLSVVLNGCLLYTSPSPRDQRGSRMPSSA